MERSFSVDIDQLLGLLGNSLYGKRSAFARELLQNALDAITVRGVNDVHFDPGEDGRIDVVVDQLANGTIYFKMRDNGTGMSEADLRHYVTVAGASSKNLNNQPRDLHLIGEFGIGMLSIFGVTDSFSIRSKSITGEEPIHVEMSLHGYELSLDQAIPIGTEISLVLNRYGREYTRSDIIQEVRRYSEMAPVNVYVNDMDIPVNMRILPWEKNYHTESDKVAASIAYLDRNFSNDILEVVPIDHLEVSADNGIDASVEGLLYITSDRIRHPLDNCQTRVYVNRFLVTDEESGLLPAWANAVGGVLNAQGLRVSVDRERLLPNDSAFRALQAALADKIQSHLLDLSTERPERAEQIFSVHDYWIKRACLENEVLYRELTPRLRWRVNSNASVKRFADVTTDAPRGEVRLGSSTLRDIVAASEQSSSTPNKLLAVTTRPLLKRFFDIADESGVTMIDASRIHDHDLLVRWVADQPRAVLVYPDRDDEGSLFRALDLVSDEVVDRLAGRISDALHAEERGLVVEARHFRPETLISILKPGGGRDALRSALALLKSDDVASDLSALAQELLGSAKPVENILVINASNKFVRQLAELVRADPDSPDANELMLSIHSYGQLDRQEDLPPEFATSIQNRISSLMTRQMDLLSSGAGESTSGDTQRRRAERTVARLEAEIWEVQEEAIRLGIVEPSKAEKLKGLRSRLMVAQSHLSGVIPKLFLSYASEDCDSVDDLYQRLQLQGFKPWMDRRDLEGGTVWKPRIEEEMSASDLIVVCLSARSIGKRGFVQAELRIAVEYLLETPRTSVRVIPVRLEECTIPRELSELHCIDVFQEGGFERLVYAVAKAMGDEVT